MSDDNMPDIAVGDWVRFYRSGVLVIATVEYVRKLDTYPYEWQAFTDQGVVDVKHLVEVRR